MTSPSDMAERDAGREKLVDAAAVADHLDIPVSWVREHTRSGHLPHVQLGRYVRYRLSAIDAWVDEQETGGAAWRKYRPRAAA